jgi:DNA (cytosine-5)-methyltransferase 1
MKTYYNENDPFAAAWLRNLIAAKLIAEGDVDERSIKEVKSEDLKNYAQCHFFAGIGVWSYSLRKADWPDDRQVWTGSCPCQPFSAAGKRKGTTDERHLWPDWFRLIEQCKPVTVFGEQVASKDGLAWFDTVSIDLEAAGYSVGAADLCAAGFGAPHVRQRLYFVGYSNTARPQGRWLSGNSTDELPARTTSMASELADPQCSQLRTEGSRGSESSTTGMQGSNEKWERLRNDSRKYGAWSNCDWLPCIDGKARPVEPGTFPLAHGVAQRVGRLRGYGNALVVPQAQAFIEAYLELER